MKRISEFSARALIAGALLVAPAQLIADVQSRIIGGCITRDVNQYPWIAALINAAASADIQGQFCGGTLVAQRWVLTAAHCLLRRNGSTGRLEPMTASQLRVMLGTNELAREGTAGEHVPVRRVHLHPGYNSLTQENDIALLELASDAPGTPARLASSSPAAGIQPLTMGWGVMGFRLDNDGRVVGVSSNLLQEVNVSVLPLQNCSSVYRNIDNRQLCAGVAEGGKDSCQGDSGGPLLTQVDGRATVSGVVSFGEGCARADRPGVYTAVSQFRSWMESVAGSDLAAPAVVGDAHQDLPVGCGADDGNGNGNGGNGGNGGAGNSNGNNSGEGENTGDGDGGPNAGAGDGDEGPSDGDDGAAGGGAGGGDAGDGAAGGGAGGGDAGGEAGGGGAAGGGADGGDAGGEAGGGGAAGGGADGGDAGGEAGGGGAAGGGADGGDAGGEGGGGGDAGGEAGGGGAAGGGAGGGDAGGEAGGGGAAGGGAGGGDAGGEAGGGGAAGGEAGGGDAGGGADSATGGGAGGGGGSGSTGGDADSADDGAAASAPWYRSDEPTGGALTPFALPLLLIVPALRRRRGGARATTLVGPAGARPAR